MFHSCVSEHLGLGVRYEWEKEREKGELFQSTIQPTFVVGGAAGAAVVVVAVGEKGE